MVTLLYKRQNIIEEVIADLFGVSQGTVSEIITELTPLIAQATEEFRPDAEDAKQMTRGRLALVDGTLWPCWSWERAPEMWAGKYKTTGHGSLIIGDEFGNIIFVSDPAPGYDHDMKKREGEVKNILDLAGSVIADKRFQGSGYVTPAKKPQHRELYTREHEYNSQVSSIRAPIERAVAHLKTWKILFTDYRRPLNTFLDSFRAAIGLYFFELVFNNPLCSYSRGGQGQAPRDARYHQAAGLFLPLVLQPHSPTAWEGTCWSGSFRTSHDHQDRLCRCRSWTRLQQSAAVVLARTPPPPGGQGVRSWASYIRLPPSCLHTESAGWRWRIGSSCDSQSWRTRVTAQAGFVPLRAFGEATASAPPMLRMVVKIDPAIRWCGTTSNIDSHQNLPG